MGEEIDYSQITNELIMDEDGADSSDDDDDQVVVENGLDGDGDSSGLLQLGGKKRQQGIRVLHHLLHANDDPDSLRKAENSAWRDLYLEVCESLEIAQTLQSAILSAVSIQFYPYNA